MKKLLLLTPILLIGHPVHGTNSDLPPAMKALMEQASAGDAHAAISLGMRYRDGKGVDRDYAEALQWYRQSADLGEPAGHDNVGFMYLRGWGVDSNFGIATAHFRAGAEKGLAQAQFNLGNSYFSGQGVEQDYAMAMKWWEQAAKKDHLNAIWRLAILHASGEGTPQDKEKALELCKVLAEGEHANGMLLLGELHADFGEMKKAQAIWERAATKGSRGAKALLELAEWRTLPDEPGVCAWVDVDHYYQGWNNCGATSIAMLAKHAGSETSPYAIKRLCPGNPIGTGTDWADLVASSAHYERPWEMVTFSYDDAGFEKGVEAIQQHLDEGEPVVIDFTIIRQEDGVEKRNGHTLLVTGYNTERDQYVLTNPNQPPPGIEIMTAEELKGSWYSVGYSRLSKGQTARPIIVMVAP